LAQGWFKPHILGKLFYSIVTKMQRATTVALLLVLGMAAASEVTPIQKVLTLMNEMKAKATKDKNDEEVRFSAFNQWCTNTKKSKTDEINAGNQKMESLAAGIEKAAVTIRELTERIQELEEDVGRWNKDKKSATTVRDAERADYTATVTDYSESIEAVRGAIGVLNKQTSDKAQASLIQTSLIQVSSLKLVPATSKKVLVSFLQQDPELDYGVPEANAYENQSGGVIEMLEKLNDEFASKKRELEKEELGAQQGFEQIMQQLSDDIENAEFEISKKSKHRAQTEENKAQLEGDLAQTTADRDEDQRYLDETTALCTQKAADFASRNQLRADEIEAISKAIEIIGGGAVAGSGDKHLPALLQIRSKAALAQLRSNQASPAQLKVVSFLNEQARKSGSRLLAEVALSAQANPFVKVKKMIKDLMVKLMEEATSETEHKGFCDTELTTNKQTRDKKTSDVNELNSNIEDLTATIASLTQDIADLTAAVKELDAAMATETKERNEAHAKNTQTIKDAKAGQVAVEQAIAVLKDFYAKAAEATAFAQQQGPADDAPETFDKPYKGQQGESGGVVGFLEVILTDFARLESDTTAAETEENDEFKNFMHESSKDKALKENEIRLKSETKTDKESALQQANEDLKTTQDQLNKALAYYQKLKPTCVDSGITYEERVKRREEEIVSLQEALKILAGTDLPTMG